MRMIAAIAAYLLLLGCSPTVTVYYRTSPRRVEISKQVSPPSLYASAARIAPDVVDVRLKRTYRVTMHRVLHYNAAALIYDHSGNVFAETIELVGGLVMLAIPFTWGLEFFAVEQDTSQRRVVRHRSYLLAFLDPTTSALTGGTHIEPVVKQQIFSDAPVMREYEIRIPAPEVNVAFRVLNEARNELVQGSATTDSYGELQIRGPLKRAVAVELSTGGAVLVVPVQPSATPVAAAPIEPAAMPHTLVGAELANEGWAKRNPGTSSSTLVPRVTLMLDVTQLPLSNLNFSGEVRLHPKLSVGGLVWCESTFDDLLRDTTVARSLEIGGYVRFYVKGNVGGGTYLGLEWLSGLSSTSDPLELTSYGLTLGYKHTFDWGVTFELATSQLYLKISDPRTPRSGASQWRPLAHVNVGWSF
jgi:hypothetical protein